MWNRMSGGWKDEAVLDVRYAWRALRARPGFTGIALLTIALGLGANTAIFGVINTMYFRPLPFDAEDRLVRVQEYSVAPDGTRRRVAALGSTFDLVREHVRSFDAVVAQTGGSLTLEGGEAAERLAAVFVSEGWGALLGLDPALGRHFTPDEERLAEDAGVVLIGHGLWQRRFGGRPDVIGDAVRLSGREYAVVGVLPPGFRFPYDAELWLPARFAPDRSLYVLARLGPGASLSRANQELEAIGQRLSEISPARGGMGVDAHSARVNLRQEQEGVAFALMGGVGFLLLIACANVAMLMTTRFVARRKEVAVRAALGCGRARQVRQFVAEALLLFTIGGALGLVLTAWLGSWLTTLVPRVLATQLAMGEIEIDWRVALFGLLLSMVTGLAFGALAAARASSADLQGVMKDGGRSSTGSGQRTLRGLVVAEIALAVVLLTGAGLMASAFQRLQDQDLGFDTEGLLTFRFDLSDARYSEAAVRTDLVDRLRQRLAAMPGVQAAGAITVNPLCCGDWGARVVIEGQVPASPEATPVIFHRYVTPGTLETMGVRLLEGRTFFEHDTAASLPVAIVDEHLAARFFPGESAVGRRMKRAPYDSTHPWLTIVGVVADVQEEGDYHEGWYLPYAQGATGPSADRLHMMVRTAGDPMTLAAPARAALAELDRSVAAYDFTTMDQIRVERVQQDRLGTVLMLLFAGFGLLLADVGVYALLAFVVGQQAREIGIRIALGATPSGVLRQVVGRGLRLAAAGLAAGLTGALVGSSVVASMVEGVVAAEAGRFSAAAALVVGLAALAACVIPAVRATRIDPMQVFRAD